MAIDLSFLRSLDRLQLILKKKVHADMQGAHESSAFGQGVQFQDFKPYVPGDDFRYIDWNVFARTNKFYVKRFEEERNLVVHILVDSSGSMQYGKDMTKFEYAAMLGLGFGYMSLRKNEKFTFATFSDSVQPLRPRKGTNQLMNIFDNMSRLQPKGESAFKHAMDRYAKSIRGRSLIVLISDFLYDLDDVREVLFRYKKSEVYVIQVLDPRERQLSLQGDVVLEDSETGQKLRSFVSRRLKMNYQQKLADHIYQLKDICEENNASFVSVATDTPIFETFYHVLR